MISFTTPDPWLVEPMSELVQQSYEYGLMTHIKCKTKRIMHLKDIKEPEKDTIELLMTSVSLEQLYF